MAPTDKPPPIKRDRRDAADQAEGQVDQHQPGVGAPVKADEQDHADQDQREAGVEQHLGLGGALGRGGAAELDIDARRQLQRRHARLGLVHRRLQRRPQTLKVIGTNRCPPSWAIM